MMRYMLSATQLFLKLLEIPNHQTLVGKNKLLKIIDGQNCPKVIISSLFCKKNF